MEAKNFRIGNWVNGEYRGFSKDVQIYGMDKKDIQHTSESVQPLPTDSFKPIRLTEDWLVRFGFEKGSNFWIKGKLKLGIAEMNYFFAIDNWNWININHVHQLQNLFFAITNTELELKNVSSTCS